MKSPRWMAAVLILGLVLSGSVRAQSPDPGRIPDEEYRLFSLALEALGGASSVSPETLSGDWKGYLLNFFEDPLKPGSEVIRNFDEKNKIPYSLLETFVQTSKKEVSGPFAQKRQARFSRVGLDLKKNRGLLVVGLTYVQPEDVMNEGKFIVLGKKDGTWVVEKILQAWDMRLGPL